jgi:hypothetical protein
VPERPWRPRLVAAALASGVTFLSIAAAFAVRQPISIGPRSGLLWRFALDEGFSVSRHYAWTLGGAQLRVPGAGPGSWRLELELSGWRPRGRQAPRVVVRSGSASRTRVVGRQPATVSLDVDQTSWVESALRAAVLSDTFVPGNGDGRALGARLYGIHLRPNGRRLGAPNLGPGLVIASLLGLILLAIGPGSAPRRRALMGAGCGVAIAALCLVARPWVVVSLPVVAIVAAVFLVMLVFLRPALDFLAGSLRASARSSWRAARDLAWPGVIMLPIATVAGGIVAHRLQPVVTVALGSRADRVVVHALGPRDSESGHHFRYTTPDSSLRLGDLGGGGPWRVSIVAASGLGQRTTDLAEIQGHMLHARLRRGWTEHTVTVRVPFAWHAGSIIGLAHQPQDDVRIAAVRIDRRGTWPSPHSLWYLLAAGGLLALALRVLGVRGRCALGIALVELVGLVALVAWKPLLGLASIDTVFVLSLVAAGLAALASGLLASLEGQGLDVTAWRAAMPATVVGFLAWTFVTTFPLYRGGHFVFHSSIAQEIWHGRFLVYYLPYPGSMLSEQAQWGSVVMPHPCLYQTLVAPLAALPRPTFYFAEKIFLGLGLASLSLAAGVVAGRLNGRHAAAFASTLVAASAPTYQMLGLGHLMALLGCWASTWAMAYLTLSIERLDRVRVRWTFIALLTLAFLSYFASVPFLGLALALLLVILWLRDRPAAGWLAYATLIAGVLAFGMYYVSWSWPFFAESVPALLRGQPGNAAAHAFLSAAPGRLLREPHKLTYTFGSWIVPLIGMAGLVLARPWRRRAVLLAWAAVLPIVCVLDVRFNFLDKHHYYSIAPVCIGAGLLLDRLKGRGRWGRWGAGLLLAGAFVLGLRTAIDAAMGFIP